MIVAAGIADGCRSKLFINVTFRLFACTINPLAPKSNRGYNQPGARAIQMESHLR